MEQERRSGWRGAVKVVLESLWLLVLGMLLCGSLAASCRGSADKASHADTGALVVENMTTSDTRYLVAMHRMGDIQILLVGDIEQSDCQTVLLVDEGRRGVVLLDDSASCDFARVDESVSAGGY